MTRVRWAGLWSIVGAWVFNAAGLLSGSTVPDGTLGAAGMTCLALIGVGLVAGAVTGRSSQVIAGWRATLAGATAGIASAVLDDRGAHEVPLRGGRCSAGHGRQHDGDDSF